MRLDKSTHRYYNTAGEEYLSVSAMLALAWPFKADEVAAKEAVRPESIYYGMTPADILADWDDRRDGGTELHAAIESFVKTGDYPKHPHPGYTGAYEFEGALFRGEFRGKLASETIMWSDRYKLAGTCDLQQLIKTDCWLWDIKTSRVIGESKWLKYSVQLHLYRVMIMEMLTAEPSILPCHFSLTEDVHVGGIIWFADYQNKPGRFKVLRPLPCWNELQWVLNMRKKML